MFNITFSGSLSGSGTFSTDGICTVCFPPNPIGGLLDLIINIGPDSGTDAFDISDDSVTAAYIRPTNLLMYSGTDSETGDILEMGLFFGDWNLSRAGSTIGFGTYSVTPVPEPSSLFLLMPILALVGLRWRHRHAMRGV